jgi:hypothetical protein
MLISLDLKKRIEAEKKETETIIKTLEKRESKYNEDLTGVKDQLKSSVEFYDKILKEAA